LSFGFAPPRTARPSSLRGAGPAGAAARPRPPRAAPPPTTSWVPPWPPRPPPRPPARPSPCAGVWPWLWPPPWPWGWAGAPPCGCWAIREAAKMRAAPRE